MSSSPQQDPDEGVVKIPRVSLDFRVPMVYLLSAAAMVGSGLIGMYYKLDSVADSVTQLKADVRASNEKTIEFAKAQAIMEFRVQKLEADRK